MNKYEINQEEANKFVLYEIKRMIDTNNPWIDIIVDDDIVSYQIKDDFYYDSKITKRIIPLNLNNYKQLLMMGLVSCGMDVDYIKLTIKRGKPQYSIKTNQKTYKKRIR